MTSARLSLLIRGAGLSLTMGPTSAALAFDPQPPMAAVDVPYDTVLVWAAGDFAATQDVYLGTLFDDVNDAARAGPRGVLLSEDQTATTFGPGPFEFGQTYYWRIDEVNAAPDSTIYKGEVWNFTVEPFAYPITGLSEVRFFDVPVQARAPMTADDAVDVSIDTVLSWRPGREATSHEVFFGTDADAVAEGTVAGTVVTGHSYTPAAMEFGTRYFWKVDEIGDAGTYEGDVWSFTTQKYAAIDDFASYTDDVDAQATIWHAWIDGLTSKASGSQVGDDAS